MHRAIRTNRLMMIGCRKLKIQEENKQIVTISCYSGVTSVYMWKGQVIEDQEQLLVIKSSKKSLAKLTEWVKGKHPYDECEVISVPITGGSETYLQWLHDCVE